MNRNICIKRILLLLVPTSWLKIVKTLPRFFPSLFLLPSYTSYRFFLVFCVLLLCFECLSLFLFSKVVQGPSKMPTKKASVSTKKYPRVHDSRIVLEVESLYIYSLTNSWRSFWLSFEYFCTFREDRRNHYTLSCDNDSNSDNGYSFLVTIIMILWSDNEIMCLIGLYPSVYKLNNLFRTSFNDYP